MEVVTKYNFIFIGGKERRGLFLRNEKKIAQHVRRLI